MAPRVRRIVRSLLTSRLLLLALPFAMFAWALPFSRSTETIGNDYVHYGPTTQLDLLWSVRSGTFPLYLPGFAHGHSTAAATLGQLYHPIAWLSSVMPGYWRGLEIEWLTFFRLLSLGVAHIALTTLLRRLRLTPSAAFVASFPVVYNLRMLDSLRFGPSIEGFVATLLACATAGFVFLDSRARRPVVLLAASTFLLAVNGHPQWALFGLMIAGLFAIGFPWVAAAIHPSFAEGFGEPPFGVPHRDKPEGFGETPFGVPPRDKPAPSAVDLKRYAARLVAGFGSGLLVASPYLLTFYVEVLATNKSRVGNGYVWTLRWSDSVLGELDNFVFPFHADVHGAFAGSALFLVAALFPIARIFTRPPRVLWFFYGVAVTAFVFALGKASATRRRGLVAAVGMASVLGVAALFYASIFHGPSFGTRYDWTPAGGAVPPTYEPPRVETLELTSTSLTGSALTSPHACADDDHLGTSPALAWSPGPEGTVGYAVVMTAPQAHSFVHWALLLPSTITSLPDGASPGGALPEGAVELRNDTGKPGYGGPCPPRGELRRYVVMVTALRAPIHVAKANAAFFRAIDEKTLARGVLSVTAER